MHLTKFAWVAAGVALVFTASADVLLFKSGSKLTGKLTRVEGGTIVFAADDVGEVKVAEGKVLELSTEKQNVVQYQDKTQEDALVNMSNGTYTAGGKVLDMTNVKAVNPVPEAWHGSVNASATAARGNTTSEKVAIVADANRRWERDRFTSNFGYYFAQSGTDRDSKEKTEDRIEIGAQEDHFWVNKIYSYVNAKYERDGINNLEYRVRLGTGLGYQWLEGYNHDLTGKWSFNQEAGLAYVRDKYEHVEDDDHATFRYAHHLSWVTCWIEDLSFTHNLEYLPDVDDWQETYLIDADAGFVYALSASWQLLGKVEWDYNSNPGGRTKKSDFRYMLGLGYKW